MTWPGWEDFDPRTHNAGVRLEKRRKYRNEPTEIDGHRFDSKREAARYMVLKLEQAAGAISGLELQPKFPMHVTGPDGVRVEVAVYISDFRYGRDGQTIIEDAKSPATRTPLYLLKKKIVEAEYGITITEV